MKQMVFVISALICLLEGCRPVKKVEKIEDVIARKDTVQTLIVKPPEVTIDSFSIIKHMLGDFYRHQLDFTTFSAKIKVDYEGKDGGDQATAYIRMQKDSVIWLSLTGALGIEGFRILITKDSIKLMNKLDKTIQYSSISYLQELAEVPLDFYGLQDIIIGNPVFLDSNVVSFRTTESALLVLMAGNKFKHLLTLNSGDFKPLHSKLDDADIMRTRTCDITFGGYETKNNISFSTQRKITVSEKSKLDINLEFKQYNFNDPETFPFAIPKNYRVK